MPFNSASYSFIGFHSARSFHISWVSLHFLNCIAVHSDVSESCQLFGMWKGELHHHSKKIIVLLYVEIPKKPQKLGSCTFPGKAVPVLWSRLAANDHDNTEQLGPSFSLG